MSARSDAVDAAIMALLADGAERTALEICLDTKRPSGTLFAHLARLVRNGKVLVRWVNSTGGAPPRRLYRLHPDTIAETTLRRRRDGI